MFQLKDNISISLYIGGNEYALGRDTFEKIYTIQNIRTVLPTCRLVLNDTVGFFESVSLSDSIPITIVMGRGNDESEFPSYNFRLVGAPKQIGIANGKQYTLNGILDNIKYLRDRPLKGYSGTSSEVITQIANECGLTPVVDKTDDTMTWFSGRLSYGNFAQQLSDYAYVDDNSCFMVGVTEDSKLLYKNITELPSSIKSPVPYFFTTIGETNNPKNFKISSSYWKQDSGTVNMLYGYNYSYTANSINGDDVDINKIKFKRTFSNKLEVNNASLDSLQNMRIEYAEPDCGNYHEHYYQAFYQNKRARCMYSTDFIVQTKNWTGQNLLDVVHAEDINRMQTDETIQTNYIVTSKTRYVSNDLQYIEQLSLTTSGKNTGNENLV